jgi:hypothetical protein
MSPRRAVNHRAAQRVTRRPYRCAAVDARLVSEVRALAGGAFSRAAGPNEAAVSQNLPLAHTALASCAFLPRIRAQARLVGTGRIGAYRPKARQGHDIKGAMTGKGIRGNLVWHENPGSDATAKVCAPAIGRCGCARRKGLTFQ